MFIPSGLTRFLQPLDISINKPFKDKLRNSHALRSANNPNNYNKKINKENIINWINDIWNNNLLIKTETVFNSFKIAGITNSMDGSEVDYFVLPDNCLPNIEKKIDESDCSSDSDSSYENEIKK